MSRVVITLALAASGLLAQAPTPGPLIRLYPVAVDAAGQPVTDLTADDFKVTDQSKPETIFAFRQPNTAAAPKLDVLEFSNRASKTPHTTVILFDMINLLDADRLENWKTLDKAIPQLDSGEHVFFYVLNLEGTLIPIHQMGVPSPDDKTWHQNVATAFDKVMKASSHARPVQVGAEEQQKKTFKAFEDLANTLSVFPGRRDILWLANGLTTVDDPKLESSNGDWVERALYVPHLAVTLANDGVAVDPYVLSGNLNADVNYNMDQMALLTGGHYYSRQDVKTVVNQVAQDAISSYTLLYDCLLYTSGIGISSLALVEHLDPAGPQPDTADPFTYKDKHVIPMVQGTVGPATKRWIYFVVYQDKANQAKPKIHVEFKNGGQVVADQTAALPEADKNGAIAMFVACLLYTSRCV